MPESISIKLLNQEIPLSLPESYALRWETSVSVSKNLTRGLAASLGVCIPRGKWPIKDAKGKEKDRPRYDYDPQVYGGLVIDALSSAGAKMPEIMAAGTAAYSMIASSVFTEDEVSEAEVFTEAPQESGEQEELIELLVR